MKDVSGRSSVAVIRTVTAFAACFAIAAIAAVAWTGVSAAGESSPQVGFTTNSPVALSDTEVEVQVVNDTPAEWSLAVDAYLQTPGSPSTRVPVDADVPKTIGPGNAATVTLGPGPSDLEHASGFVVVTATGGGKTTISRRELVITPHTPKPKVTKWSGSNQTFTISGAASGVPDLPLEGSDCGSLEEVPHEAAVTAGSQIAILEYTCVPGEEESPARLVFDAGDIDEVGQYAGTLQIGDKSVDLSYLESRSMWLAMLVILIGLLAALLRQIWTDAVRPVRRADERLTLVGRDALARQTEFEQRAGTASYRVYNLVRAVAPEVARLQRELARLRPGWHNPGGWRVAFGWGSGDEQDRLDDVVDEARHLDDVVQAWPALADDFEDLDEQARAVGQPDEDPPARLAPALVATARSLLAPLGPGPTTKELTINEARKLLTDVPKTTKALELLPVAKVVHEDVKALPEPREMTDDHDVWAKAHRLDRQILAELALAKDVASLEQAHVDALLVRVRALVRQLPPRPGGRLAAAQGEDAITEPAIALFSGASRFARTLWSALGTTRIIDLVWLLVAMATAFWSGLALYYVDKPWGRPADFLILSVWAFGTTTILTPILSALENVTAGALPLKKSKADAEKPKP